MTTIYNQEVPQTTIVELLTTEIKTSNKNEILVSGSSNPFVHNNYLEYLGLGWRSHLGVIIDPIFFWHMILSEVSLIVKNDPDKYQNLFSTSDEKQEVVVMTNDPQVIPVNKIVEQLRHLVPSDINSFFPEFSTKTEAYTLATQITFCDTVSPYYNYSMYMCGIPSFTINGTDDDWKLLSDSATKLFNLLDIDQTFELLLHQLKTLTYEETRNELDTWTSMFKLDRCGSGSQVEVGGWIRFFFHKNPDPGYIGNYSSHIASMNYINLDTKIRYTMYSGLFHSTLVDNQIIPEYSWFVKEQEE